MSGVYNSKYTGEQIDAMLHDKEVKNISDTQTIYPSPSALPTLTANDNGKRCMAQMESGKPYKIGVYHWMNDTQKWEFLFQLTGSTLYIGLDTRLIYQYRSSAPYLRPLSTATVGAYASTNENSHFKISDFGPWKGKSISYLEEQLMWGVSMLITARAGETVLLTMASNDDDRHGRALRLVDTHGKIAALHYCISEEAIYVTTIGWCNNITATILANTNNIHFPKVEVVDKVASDAVSIDISNMCTSYNWLDPITRMLVGNTNHPLRLLGPANERPQYNGSDLALMTDVTKAINDAIGGALAAANVCYVSDAVPAASVGKDGDICIVSG